MSIIQRIQHAIAAFNQPTAARGLKSAPFAFPSWVNGQPQWNMADYGSYVRNGFERNAVIYSAVMYKCRAITAAPLRAYTGELDSRKLLPISDPFAKLIQRPNPYQSTTELFGQAEVCLNLAGNAYIYIERAEGGKPKRLWCLRPDRVYIIPGGDGILGYKYTPIGTGVANGLAILPEDMIHIKLPNPLDDLEGLGYGLSPLAAMAQSGDVDNDVTSFLKTLFENRTMLGGVLKFKMPLSKSEANEARERWEERYGGVKNWGSVAVLDNEGDFVPFAPDFQKLAFDSLDKRNVGRMLGPFGVPGMLIGFQMDNSTFSNFEQADRVFWTNTFIPELRLIESEVQYALSDGTKFPAFDLANVPALQKDVPALVDAAQKMWSMGTPRRVAYVTVGLNVPEGDGDDMSYLPVGVLPADLIGKPQQLPPKAALPPPAHKSTEPTRKTRWASDAEAKQLVKTLDLLAVSRELSYQAAAAQCFEADKREILALVTALKDAARQRKATIVWTDLETDVKAYLEGAGAENWRNTFVPLQIASVEDTGKFWAAQLGLAFDVRNLLGEEWFADYTLQFAQPINQTSSGVLHDVLATAQAEGWSIYKMQTNLTALFDQWAKGNISAEDLAWIDARNTPYRAEMIARTETTHIQAAGAHALFTAWEVEEHEWLSTSDTRTRDSHKKANRQRRKLSEPFTVGDYKMMYPGDTSLGAPVSEIVLCRCTTIPVVDE